MQIDWGDRSRKLRRRSAVHHYKKGRFTLTVRAVDKAGNVTAKKKALRIPCTPLTRGGLTAPR